MPNKLKCPQCGNDQHFMVNATMPVTIRIESDGTPVVVATYEGRAKLDSLRVHMCMECSRPDAFVGDDPAEGRAVYAQWSLTEEEEEPTDDSVCSECGQPLADGVCVNVDCAAAR